MSGPATYYTAQRIIRMAYKDAGLIQEGDEPNGEQYADGLMRLVGQKLGEPLGQPVVVEVQAGAGGLVGAQSVLRAPADGYTLLYSISTTLVTTPHLVKNRTVEMKDFAPVTTVNSNGLILVLHPSVPARSVHELVAVAKLRPGQLNYSTAGTGSAGHLAVELFKAMAGVDIVRVPFRGATSALNSLLSGQVQILILGGSTAVSQIQSGRLRPLAVAAPEPASISTTLALCSRPVRQAPSTRRSTMPARSMSAAER